MASLQSAWSISSLPPPSAGYYLPSHPLVPFPGITPQIGGFWQAGISNMRGPGRPDWYVDNPQMTRPGMGAQARGALKSYTLSSVHRQGAEWARWSVGAQARKITTDPITGKVTRESFFTAGRFVGAAFGALAAYEGYQRGGVWGAAKGVAVLGAESYAFGAALNAMGGGLAVGGLMLGGLALGAAGAALGGASPRHLLRPWINEDMKKHARIEMGTPVMDQYGTVATMRQRSINAIQNSKINGRTALGNEAALMYRSYYR
jgi:hypothetical protein